MSSVKKDRYMFCLKNKKCAIIIKIFLIFLFLATHQNMSLTSAAFSTQETIIPILTYHNFTSDESSSYKINIDKFTNQMEYLANHDFSVISMSELVAGLTSDVLPCKPVVITIDDGYKSTYTLAYPILKKYHFPATLFIYTDFIEKNSHSLTWGEIREMTENNIEIGSHTISHCNLIKLKEKETNENYLNRIRREIFLSKEILENEIGKEVQFFAYPYGIYSPQVTQLVIQADYKGIFNVNSMNSINTDFKLFSLNRQIIFGQNSLNSLIQILNQLPLNVSQIFPYDGIIESNQFVKIGAILEGDDYNTKTLNMKLGGAKVKFDFNLKNREISFTPDSSKPLIKKSYIVTITALDKNSQYLRKTSWLITIK